MGIEVFDRKRSSFLKNPDILPRDAFRNHVEKVRRNGDGGVCPEVLVLPELLL
jgi:hypothetical protein